MNYQRRIKEVREKRGLTEDEVGKVVHLSREEYKKIETGERELLAEELFLLKRYYRVSADYLVGLTDKC